MLIYKILRDAEWTAFERDRCFAGSADDVRDGFIHISTAAQVAGTLARHFAGEAGLWSLTLDSDALGEALRWEPSRGGALFPHLYRALDRAEVVAAVRVSPERSLRLQPD